MRDNGSATRASLVFEGEGSQSGVFPFEVYERGIVRQALAIPVGESIAPVHPVSGASGAPIYPGEASGFMA